MFRMLKPLIHFRRVALMTLAPAMMLVIFPLNRVRTAQGIVAGFVGGYRTASVIKTHVNRSAGDSASKSDSEIGLPLADDPSGATTGVPDYNLMTLKGREMRLSSLRGKVTLLDIFRSTCPHCQAHAPFISEIAKRYRDRKLTVVGLSTDNYYVDRESVDKYVRDAKIDTEIVFAPFDVIKLYLAQDEHSGYFVPQAALFDKDGRFIARFTRWEEKDRPGIEKAIEKTIELAISK